MAATAVVCRNMMSECHPGGRYGVLTSPAKWSTWLFGRTFSAPLLLCYPALAAVTACAWGIERLGAARLAQERRVRGGLSPCSTRAQQPVCVESSAACSLVDKLCC